MAGDRLRQPACEF